MKRIIDHFLLDWKSRKRRKSLIIRGARQVGKTYAVRQLGKTFQHFVEVNLERDETARKIMEQSLDLKEIIIRIGEHKKTKIIPGKTLLFFDEVQVVPKTLTALRYFYEEMPDLHVIAAGSLLDFAIDQMGIPVGRVNTLSMYPLSFLEFLAALGHKEWVALIISKSPLFEELHAKLMEYVGLYLAIGGMPDAVNAWLEEGSSREVRIAQDGLLYTYLQDFGKYSKKNQVKYLELIFKRALSQLSRKFIFSRIDGYKKRELEPAIDLLVKAGLFYQVYQSSGQGIPLGGAIKPDFFKLIFLDVGLTQALLDYDISSWIIEPLTMFANKGELIEAFVGQELLAYADPIKKDNLYYWRYAKPSTQAEIDYLIQIKNAIIPIEVKAGNSTRLKSMHLFLKLHPSTPYGLRFWADNAQTEAYLHSYPLYAIARPISSSKDYMQTALLSLAK